MPILHNVRQRSEEWEKLRLGVPTSSCFNRIVTPGGKYSEQWDAYACHLIAERLLGRKLDGYVSPWMERGAELENDAVHWYELDRDLDTEEIGFVTTDDGRIGCSPDRLVGNDGLLEIKIPSPATQVHYLISGSADRKYKPQLQGQLWISRRQWVDILAWHEELPRIAIRIERDDKFIATMAAMITEFADNLEQIMAKIRATGYEPAAPRQTLQAAMRARLEIVP